MDWLVPTALMTIVYIIGICCLIVMSPFIALGFLARAVMVSTSVGWQVWDELDSKK